MSRSCKVDVIRLQESASTMKPRRRNVSDDSLTITQRNTQTKDTSVSGRENSEMPIPVDLIIEIFLRLPAKSLARCRFVSKLWSSIFHSPDFTELFLTRSRTRPQLLFACKKNAKVLFFSSPQPQNLDVNSSPVVSANELMHFPFDGECEITGHVDGWICLINKRISTRKVETVAVICNPSTGQSLTLPKVKTQKRKDHLGYYPIVKQFKVLPESSRSVYLGYDTIDNQFKVLSITSSSYGRNSVFDEYQILTIGSGNFLSWRTIKCCKSPYYSPGKGIFIDGVLYYRALEEINRQSLSIVCFDFRSEKFSFITVYKAYNRVLSVAHRADNGTLINYNGKLGSLQSDYVGWRYGSGSIELCVLEDAEKNEWSKHSLVLPAMWQNILGVNWLRFVGMTRTNEMVFKPMKHIPFCLFYYNIEKNTITKVRIQGMEAFEDTLVYECLNHVEDVKLM